MEFVSATGLLYVVTNGGLAIINTQNTPTNAGDDTLVATLNSSSTPALLGDTVTYLTITGNYMIIAAATAGVGGISVIDTQGTWANPADDSVVATYPAGDPLGPASAALLSSVHYDSDTMQLHFIDNMSWTTIDTNGTLADSSDDTLANRYTYGSDPRIPGRQFIEFQPDIADNLWGLVTFEGGLTILDHKSTLDFSDDTVVQSYGFDTSIGFKGGGGLNSVSKNSAGTLFLSSQSLGVVAIHDNLQATGDYRSPIFENSSSYKTIRWEAETPSGTQVQIRSRTGSADAYWVEEFEGATPVQIFKGPFGDLFDTVEQSGGMIKLSDPQSTGVEIYFKLSETADYYPSGSTVRIRARVFTAAINLSQDFYIDDDWGGDSHEQGLRNGQWMELTLNPTEDFSRVSLYLGFLANWSSGDYVEIDWIRVESANGWSAWSDPYTEPTGSTLTNTSDPYIQLRATLATADTQSTPSLKALAIGE
jgi:hypothetical protein